MSVGSAFDAFVKSALHKEVCEPDKKYELETLFNSQVDEDARTFAWEAGEHLFDCYVKAGAYAHLLGLLQAATEPPRFEFTLKKTISGVPLIGKPDCSFSLEKDVTLDWKVNGYCSKSATSPRPYYMMCVDSWDETEAKATRGGNQPHKKFTPMEFGGITIGAHWMEDVCKDWADQLAIYNWMLGFPVGCEDVVTCIDQLCCKPSEPKPLVRIAQHRCRISADWQFKLVDRLKKCWKAIQDEHIFTDMTKEESKARCEVLEMAAAAQDDDPMWALLTKKGYYG
jgi:hypothetical protein